MDIQAITQSARIVTDDQGALVVMLPLPLWTELLNQINAQSPQNERLKAILKRWQAEPDDQSPEWWEEFDSELKANRTTFPLRDSDPDKS